MLVGVCFYSIVMMVFCKVLYNFFFGVKNLWIKECCLNDGMFNVLIWFLFNEKKILKGVFLIFFFKR